MFLFVTQDFWVCIVRICLFFLLCIVGLFEITEWGPCIVTYVTVEHRHFGRKYSEIVTLLSADSGKPRIVLYCVKRSMSKSVAVLPQVLKIHC